MQKSVSNAGQRNGNEFRQLQLLIDAVEGESADLLEVPRDELLKAKDLAIRLEAAFQKQAQKERKRRPKRDATRNAKHLRYAISAVDKELARRAATPIDPPEPPQQVTAACLRTPRCAPPESDDEEAISQFEQCVRIRRLDLMSANSDTPKPQVESLEEETLLSYPIPALRITWPDSVFFDVDKDQLRPEAASVLQFIADAVAHDVEDLHLYVLGHTDDTGARHYNQNLSDRRAQGVAQRLAALGVPQQRISSRGLGELQPVQNNDSPTGQAANRRVEFMLSSYKQANHKLVADRPIDLNFIRPDEERIQVKPWPREERLHRLPPVETTQSSSMTQRYWKHTTTGNSESQPWVRFLNEKSAF